MSFGSGRPVYESKEDSLRSYDAVTSFERNQKRREIMGFSCLRNLFGTGFCQLASGNGGSVEEEQQPTNFDRLQPLGKKLAVLGNLAHNKMPSKTNFGSA